LKRDAEYEEERKKREKEEEEEEKHLTLEQFYEGKKKTHFKKEARKPEELKKANIEKASEKVEKISTIASNLRNQETYNASQV
jgi:hypothetical protein